jgi:2'-5' RNA ligase
VHITLLGSFLIELSEDEIIKELSQIAQNYTPFTITIGDDIYLGEHKDILVSTIEYSERLQSLHSSIVSSMLANNAQIRNPHFFGDMFTPHITVQKSERFYKGTQLPLKEFSLIQHEPHGISHERILVNNVSLLSNE